MTKAKSPKTVADLMEATGLKEYAVRNAIKAGQLPGYQIGRFYVVPNEAFDAFLNGTWVPLQLPKPASIRPLPHMLKRRAS